MTQYQSSVGLYTIKAGQEHKVIASEPTIGDICAACNNGFLSKLDEYGSALYRSYFAPFPTPGKLVRFEYEYHKLFRWLLKVWFNHWRAREWGKTFGGFPDSFVSYIRDGAVPKSQLVLYAQILRATPLEPPSQEPDILSDYNEFGFNPCVDRMGLAHPDAIPGFGPGLFAVFRSFCFYGFFGLVDAPLGLRRKTMQDFVRQTPGVYELSPKIGRINMYVSGVDHLALAAQSEPFQRNVRLKNRFVAGRSTSK